MSEEQAEQDVLLRALRDLPKPDATGAAQDRARREARAAFQRAASRDRPRSARPTPVAALGGGRFAPPGDRSFRIGSLAVPAVLAGVVFVYLGWAISTVNALAH